VRVPVVTEVSYDHSDEALISVVVVAKAFVVLLSDE
jgi:hypothetical protein